ncbi:MAG TPA: hypothetical protein VFJ23_06570 [Candidatus Nitrosotalea sp.]|jgi:hypothetical protein|nr:hypothetical protein [Candidatus Nitrosotalea sp.]
MTNAQFGFELDFSGTPRVFGASVSFNVDSSIKTIAGKAASGLWCNAGNLYLHYTDTGVPTGTPQWVECAVSYFSSGGPGVGWWLSTAYSNTGGTPVQHHYSISVDPTTHTVTLKLYYDSVQGSWYCSYSDPNGSTITGQAIVANVPNANGADREYIFFENGGDTNCCDYSTLGGITFSSLTYFNSTGSVISPSPTTAAFLPSATGQPPHNCANTSSTCINENTTTLKLTYNG